MQGGEGEGRGGRESEIARISQIISRNWLTGGRPAGRVIAGKFVENSAF